MAQLAPRIFRRLPRTQAAVNGDGPGLAATVPALLVSVRHPLEAQAAVAGGCDLLDIKEPARGSLGMADVCTMAAIGQFAAECRGKIPSLPCSAALGELVEWESRPPLSSVPAGICYVKLGPAGVETPARWVEAWRNAKSRLESPSQPHLRWVAVAYADWQRAQSVEPARLLEAAATAGCDVFLIDTFEKSDGNLLNQLDVRQLRRLCHSAHRAGLNFALAGSLRRAQLREVIDVGPDIVGVRGAACAGGRRTAPISAKAVRALKRELARTFTGQPEPSVGW